MPATTCPFGLDQTGDNGGIDNSVLGLLGGDLEFTNFLGDVLVEVIGGSFDLNANGTVTVNEAGISDQHQVSADLLVYNASADYQIFKTSAAGNNEQPAVAADSRTAEIALPTVNLPAFHIPAFSINSFDISGFSAGLADVLSGREFYGYAVPEFTLPELAIPGFDVADYADVQAPALEAQSFSLPAFTVPVIGGHQRSGASA